MKNRYIAVSIALTFILGLAFIGCAEDPNDNTDAISGSWELVSITMLSGGQASKSETDEVSGTMLLGNNGSNWNMIVTSPYHDERLSDSGQSWTADGNVLTLERGSEQGSYTYSLNADILTFTTTDSGVSITYEWLRYTPSRLF